MTGSTFSRFGSGILSKNVLSADHRVPIRVATPPVSSISFLPTAHARILTPPGLEGLTVEVGAWRLELGTWRLEVDG